MTPPAAPTRLRVAHVLRTHGVRGEVLAEPLGGDASRFTPGLVLFVEHPSGVAGGESGGDNSGGESGGVPPTVVRSARAQGLHVRLGFEGVDTAQSAAALRGAYLAVDRLEARPLATGEWFVWQIVGLEARDPEDNLLGVVTDVEPGVASDVLVVAKEGEVSRFPMVSAFVSSVDVAGGRITLEPWESEL